MEHWLEMGYACLEISFTKNVDGLETSQLFCIAHHWTGFCLEFLLKGVFEQSKVSSLMFQKVFQALISSDMNVNLWFLFSFEVAHPECHVQNTPFAFTIAQKFILNDCLVFKLFVFFLDILKKIITATHRLVFFQRVNNVCYLKFNFLL